MVQLTTVFSALILAGAVLTSPTPDTSSKPTGGKTVKDILISVYGPLDTWTPIKLTDKHPGALFEGKPANDSIIYGHEPPKNCGKEKHDLATTLISALHNAAAPHTKARDLEKRFSRFCYRTGTAVFQNQLQSAKNTVCNDASGANISNGGTFGMVRDTWFDGTSWQRFVNNQGTAASVWFSIKVNPGFGFEWNNCFNAFYDVIFNCHGSRPDSQGGNNKGANGGQNDANVDPL